MANPSDHPFLPATFPTWAQILTAPVLTHPAQDHTPVFSLLKTDSSTVIQPFQIVTNVGAIWSNAVDTFMRVAWPSIVAVATGTVSAGAEAWVELSDTVTSIPFSLSDVGKVPTLVNDGGVARLDLMDIGDEVAMSGITSLGSGALTVNSLTEVAIAAGVGRITERIVGGGRVYHDVVWNALVQAADVNDPANFWYVEDTGMTGIGTIVRSLTPQSPGATRTIIRLGMSLHDEVAGEVDATVYAPDVFGDQGQLLNDLLRLKDAVSIESGNLLEIAATLTFDRTQTNLFGKFINAGVSLVDPNHITINAAGGAQAFDTIAEDGTAFNEAVTSVPKTWNNSGVETALTGNSAAVHQIFILPNGDMFCQLSTTSYSNYDSAVAAISLEKLMNPLWSFGQLFGARMGNAVLSAQATTLWEDGKAHLFPDTGSSGGGGTGGVTTFLGLGDTPGTYPVGSAGRFVIVGPAEDQVIFATPDELTFPAPSLSFSHSDPITLTSDPESPAWDEAFTDVDTNYFTYPVVGNLSANEVSVLKRAIYRLHAGASSQITAGNYASAGLSFFKNGQEIEGTLARSSGTENSNIQHIAATVEVELAAIDEVTPGFYKLSGSQDLIGGSIHFSIQLVRELPEAP